MKKRSKNQPSISRRSFIQTGSSILAGSLLASSAKARTESEEKDIIKSYRKLGRTGFEVSDISMGGTRNREMNVFRYAYDKGVNYFDTAETYINGNSQILLGEALKHMDRKKIFITTKLHLDDDESADSVLNRFNKCQEKLQTEYIDALYMHNPSAVELLNHQGFHQTTTQLRAEGRLRFIGLSCHGPRRGDGDSMEKVLCTAAEDGRFDLMLLIYNFMQEGAGNKILSACKKKNVGTSAMKTKPGVIQVEKYNPDSPTPSQKEYIQRMEKRGLSTQEAVQRLKNWLQDQAESQIQTKPFADKYGLNTDEQLHIASVRWVLSNKDMHTACISFSDFDQVDKYIAFSGTYLSARDREFIEDFGSVFKNGYCRHGCTSCTEICRHKLPVSTIMRYAYYFDGQHREKEAMKKYELLGSKNSLLCAGCDAPCMHACPFQLNIPSQLYQAHSLLTSA